MRATNNPKRELRVLANKTIVTGECDVILVGTRGWIVGQVTRLDGTSLLGIVWESYVPVDDTPHQGLYTVTPTFELCAGSWDERPPLWLGKRMTECREVDS